MSARQVSALNPKWKSILLEAKPGGRREELYDISDPAAAGSLYFGRLDEGDYDIVEVHSLGPGPGLLLAIIASDSQSLRSHLATVHVRAGALLNLGTLVLQPALDPKAVPEAELLDGAIGRGSAMEDFERRTGRKIDMPVDGVERSVDEERQALVRARSMITMIGWGDDAQGSALFGGAALGQIASLGREGKWRIDTLDTLDDVKYARRLPDGTLIAGFVQGRYAVRRPGKGWTYLSLPQRDMVIAYAEPTADGGAIFVAGDMKNAAVLKRSSLEAPEAEVRTVLALDFPVHLRPNPVLQLEGGFLIVQNHPGFSRVADLTLVDRETLQARKTSVDFWIQSWQRMPSGEILATRQNGMSYYKAASVDRGATWVRGEAQGPLQARYVDAERGYGLNITPGAWDITLELMKTIDGGRSWSKAGAPMVRKGGASRLLSVSETEVVAAIGAEMLSTRDEGKTWTRAILRDSAPDAIDAEKAQ